MAALGPLLDSAGDDHQGRSPSTSRHEVEYLERQERRRAPRRRRGRPPVADARRPRLRGDPGAVRDDQRPTSRPRASRSSRGAPARQLPTSPPSTRASGSPSPTPRPRRCRSSPRRSGRARRPAAGGTRPFTINVERLKPWHTLTGRQHFYLDHDWMIELGECLPVFRPPLNMTRLFGETAIGERQRARRLRALPHPAQQVVDPLRVPGQPLHALAVARRARRSGSADQDAAKIGVTDNDWVEAVNRNGVVVARAIVSHRMPEGTVVHAPCPGPAHRRPAHRDQRPSGRHPQLPDPDPDEAEPHHRRVRPAVLRLQLSRARRATTATR